MIDTICIYVCLKCQKKFSKLLPGPTQCPHCGHLYVKWINYGDKFIEKKK